MFKIVLALRYLAFRPISWFSVIATGLCVFVVVVVVTVLSGLAGDFKNKTHSFVGDCVVKTDSLVGFCYYGEFLEELRDSSGHTQYTTLKLMGVEPMSFSRVTGFADWLYYNPTQPANAFRPSYDRQLAGCVPAVGAMFPRDSQGEYQVPQELGRLKFELGCFPLTAKGAPAKAGAGEINTKVFYYSDLARTGLANADTSLIFVPFEDAQYLCGMQMGLKRTTAIHIKFRKKTALDAGCAKVKKLWEKFAASKAGAQDSELLDKVRVASWKTHSRIFIAAVDTEQTMMIAVFGLLGLITVFIVFVVLYMIVTHKRKDVGILKSVGASNGGVLSLFLEFGLLAGLLGSLIGFLGGWAFLVNINKMENWLWCHYGFQLWDRRIYAIGDIPSRIDAGVVLVIVCSAVLACLLGSFVPSCKAGRLRPVETLQVKELLVPNKYF